MISWFTICVLLLIFVIGFWWIGHTKARERSTAAVKSACKRNQYQFLDGTVSLKKVRIRRAYAEEGDLSNGLSYCLQWVFTFDYYDSESRCQGRVFWNCGKLEKIEFVAKNNNVSPENKVVNIDDFRK